MPIKLKVDSKGKVKIAKVVEEFDDATAADQKKTSGYPCSAVLYKTEKVVLKGKSVEEVVKMVKGWKKNDFTVAGKVNLRPVEVEDEIELD